jgi:outer membrane protein OmpA-like peptidoglycan-associated protein
MTRMIRAAAAAAVLVSGLGSVGCVHTGSREPGQAGDRYRNFVDPCYPERYQHAARQAVVAPFAQQVHNGHFLNQTVWNYHFEAGSDKLTPGGKEKLDSLARVRPSPDPKVYIQTANDLPQTADAADTVIEARNALDAKRAQAIQKYLATVPTGAPVSYEVYVHNAAVPGINSEFAARAYRGSQTGYVGNITGQAGLGALGTGGAINLTAAPVGAGGVGAGGAGAPAPGQR